MLCWHRYQATVSKGFPRSYDGAGNSLRVENVGFQFLSASQLPDATRSPFGSNAENTRCFSRVVAAGLFTSGPGKGQKSVLSRTVFSKAVHSGILGNRFNILKT